MALNPVKKKKNYIRDSRASLIVLTVDGRHCLVMLCRLINVAIIVIYLFCSEFRGNDILFVNKMFTKNIFMFLFLFILAKMIIRLRIR